MSLGKPVKDGKAFHQGVRPVSAKRFQQRWQPSAPFWLSRCSANVRFVDRRLSRAPFKPEGLISTCWVRVRRKRSLSDRTRETPVYQPNRCTNDNGVEAKGLEPSNLLTASHILGVRDGSSLAVTCALPGIICSEPFSPVQQDPAPLLT